MSTKKREAGTPVTLAFNKKRKELVKLLMDHGATFTDADPEVLLEAVKSGPIAEIKELLAYGMDPNCHGKDETPIGVSFQCCDY